MDFIPAIDLKGGQCVRLNQGRMDDATIYSGDPLAVAKAFQDQGVRRLHIVDLDGAFAGEPVHFDVIVKLIKALPKMKVQVGGGLRQKAHLQAYMDAKASRLILGTKAVQDPDFFKECANTWPHRILLGLDSKDGQVAIAGWAETSQLRVQDLVERVKGIPVAGVVCTDISKDGMMNGVGLRDIENIAFAKLPIIASGGISGIDDLKALIDWTNHRRIHLSGVIVGRAIYEGELNIGLALSMCRHLPKIPADLLKT